MLCSTDLRISCSREFKSVQVVGQSTKGIVQKENTAHTEKNKCIYFDVGATGLKVISEIRGFILCTTQVHLKKSRILYKNTIRETLLLCLIFLRTTWHLSHPDNTLCSFVIACNLQYNNNAPGVQTEFVQFDVFLTVHHSIDFFKLPT